MKFSCVVPEPKLPRSSKLIAAPLATDEPIYGDRDLSIHDDVNELSRERRKGYGWFKDTGKRVEEHYAKWVKLHPTPKP